LFAGLVNPGHYSGRKESYATKEKGGTVINRQTARSEGSDPFPTRSGLLDPHCAGVSEDLLRR
jgi:hypothetical protein